MTIKQFASRYKLPTTGRGIVTHYRKSRIAQYQVVCYPDGEIWGEIYNQRGGNKFIQLV